MKKQKDATPYGLLPEQNLGQTEQAKTMEAENKRIPDSPNLDIKATIVENYSLRTTHFKNLLTDEKLHAIGETLIDTYGDIARTASVFHISPTLLRILIRTQYILQEYWREAFQGIKQLADGAVIQGLREQEEWAVKMVHRTLYKGRNAGAYNPNEFGALGYEDTVAAEQKSHVEQDIKQRDVQIVVQFGDGTETNYIDAELVDEIGV